MFDCSRNGCSGVVTAALVALSMTLAACGDGGNGSTTVTVFAAASLTDAFEELASAFEDEYPDLDVVFNFGGSSSLREQLLAGAPADVYASANTTTMDAVVEAGIVAEPAAFAANQVRIAVPAGNPAGVVGLADFADEELLIGLCAAPVPCGEFARTVLQRAGVVPAPDTEEPDVRALVTKLAAGELDAGLVYATDVIAEERIDGIDVPDEAQAVATYPIALVVDRGTPTPHARAFVEFVRSDAGQRILADHGFGPATGQS